MEAATLYKHVSDVLEGCPADAIGRRNAAQIASDLAEAQERFANIERGFLVSTIADWLLSRKQMRIKSATELCSRVFEVLDRATGDDYENILFNNTRTTANWISEHDTLLRGVDPVIIKPFVTAWLRMRQ